MSEPLKSIHVRLSPEAYARLVSMARAAGVKISHMARSLIEDALFGRGRGLPSVEVTTSEGFVYVIRIGDLFKIGRSREPYRRITGMSLPQKPEIVCTIKTATPREVEQAFHKEFAPYRHHGEWFKLPAEAVAELRGRASV